MKTWKTVLEMAQPELFEKRKILKIGQVVVILVHFEVDQFYSVTEYSGIVFLISKILKSIKKPSECQ